MSFKENEGEEGEREGKDSAMICKILDENNFGDYPVFAQCSLSVR